MSDLNYADLTLEELNAACAAHWESLMAIRQRIIPGIDPIEKLHLELQAAEHRAHLNVIQPLRTAAFVEDELARSDFAQRLAGMTPDQINRLRQRVAVASQATATRLHGPGE